jgi:hypothetical protein
MVLVDRERNEEEGGSEEEGRVRGHKAERVASSLDKAEICPAKASRSAVCTRLSATYCTILPNQ